jgi:16S rRNA processing protein RimM
LLQLNLPLKVKLLRLKLQKRRLNPKNDLVQVPMRVRIGIFVLDSIMKLESCYRIGKIARPHGLKGEVTVLLEEAPINWDDLKTVFILSPPNELVPYFIEQLSVRGTKAYIKFEDLNTPEAANSISKRELYLPKTERPKAGKGEFYDDEVVGFEVDDSNHGFLGTIDSVETTAMSRLLVIKTDQKEILIPVLGPFITSINKSKKKIHVDLPDGFLDI